MTRTQFNYILANKCNNDISNLITLTHDGNSPIDVQTLIRSGSGYGIEYVDVAIGNGEYLTGFYTYRRNAPSMSAGPDEFIERFLPIDQVFSVSWKQPTIPSYVST